MNVSYDLQFISIIAFLQLLFECDKFFDVMIAIYTQITINRVILL